MSLSRAPAGGSLAEVARNVDIVDSELQPTITCAAASGSIRQHQAAAAGGAKQTTATLLMLDSIRWERATASAQQVKYLYIYIYIF